MHTPAFLSETDGQHLDLRHYYLRLRPRGVPLSTFAFDLGHYVFAERFVRGKVVLDAATGKGYGAFHLAKVGRASTVSGIDLDEESLVYACNRHRLRNLFFGRMDVTSMGFRAGSFDVVVSFETLEHIAPAKTIQFMREVVRVLRPDGALLISTPNRPVYSVRTRTAGHINEMDSEEFRTLLSSFFEHCRFYYQGCNWLANTTVNRPTGAIGKALESAMSHLCWLRIPFAQCSMGRWLAESRFARLLEEHRVRAESCAHDLQSCLIQTAVCRNPKRTC